MITKTLHKSSLETMSEIKHVKQIIQFDSGVLSKEEYMVFREIVKLLLIGISVDRILKSYHALTFPGYEDTREQLKIKLPKLIIVTEEIEDTFKSKYLNYLSAIITPVPYQICFVSTQTLGKDTILLYDPIQTLKG